MMVWLNIYDLTNSSMVEAVNNTLPFGAGGVFHMCVQVMGREYSYGACHSGTGVHSFKPRTDPAHRFRESVPLGITKLSEEEVDMTVRQVAAEWQGKDYHWARRNCWHCSKAFAAKLGVGPLPAWVDELSQVVQVIASPLEGVLAAIKAVSGKCQTCKPTVAVHIVDPEMRCSQSYPNADDAVMMEPVC